MATASPHDRDDLSPEEEAALQSDHIVIRPKAGGKRTVSAAFLTPSTSEASLSSGSSAGSAASAHLKNVTASGRNLDLPVTIESAATVEFLGFTPQAAVQVYDAYSNRTEPRNNPDDLIDFALARVSEVPESFDISEREAMTRMGLNEQVQNAILDPLHSEVYFTETLRYWIRNTIEINWKTLLQLKAQLKAAAVKSKGKKPRKHVGSIFPPIAGPSQQPAEQQAVATVQSTVSELLSAERNLPKAHVSLATGTRTDLPHHYTLWKGKAACEMTDWISEDGSIQIAGLQTSAGGDFNFNDAAYYWTQERDTAEKYCAYAAVRCMYSEIWLLHVQVPKTFIDSLNTKSLFYGSDWKNYVWHCRKKLEPGPKYLDFWQGGVEMIRGHICSSNSRKITRVKAQEVQDNITEDDVMALHGGQKATQWALMKYETASRFAREIHGKIDIEIRPPSQYGISRGTNTAHLTRKHQDFDELIESWTVPV